MRINKKSFNLLSGLAWICLRRWGPFGYVGRSAGGGPSASWEVSAVGKASAFDESASWDESAGGTFLLVELAGTLLLVGTFPLMGTPQLVVMDLLLGTYQLVAPFA